MSSQGWMTASKFLSDPTSGPPPHEAWYCPPTGRRYTFWRDGLRGLGLKTPGASEAATSCQPQAGGKASMPTATSKHPCSIQLCSGHTGRSRGATSGKLITHGRNLREPTQSHQSRERNPRQLAALRTPLHTAAPGPLRVSFLTVGS